MKRIALAGAGSVSLALIDFLLEASVDDPYSVVALADSTGCIHDARGLAADALAWLVRGKRAGGKLHELAAGVHGAAFEPAGLEALLRPGFADVLVELGPTDTTTGGPSLVRAMEAAESGIHLVCASKGPFVARLPDGSPARSALIAAAEKSGAVLRYSATVGSATPMIDVGCAVARGGGVAAIRGALNATSSLIMGLVENGLTLSEAVTKAQALGMAEADPSADIDGFDAAAKLCILCAEILDADLPVASIRRESVRAVDPERLSIAAARGKKLRPVARAERRDGGVSGSVTLEEVEADSPLAASGGDNAVVFVSERSGSITVSGTRAGPRETASAVLRDLRSAIDR